MDVRALIIKKYPLPVFTYLMNFLESLFMLVAVSFYLYSLLETTIAVIFHLASEEYHSIIR